MDLKILRVRTLSACVLLLITLLAFWAGGHVKDAYIFMMMVLALGEWLVLCFYKSPFSSTRKIIWALVGGILISMGFLGFYRAESILFQAFGVGVIISNDIFAYLTGSIVKGPKLATGISPNKTWSGSLGGMIGACLFSLAFAYGAYALFSGGTSGDLSFLAAVMGFIFPLAILTAILAQIGDLLQSWAKRKIQVKDSGHIIPGHGGILDRLDAIIFVFFVYFIISDVFNRLG